MQNSKPFVLITGDDSVRAEGAILVKRIVEKFADFQIVATKNQQSVIGSGFTVRRNIEWGREMVDGHSAIWVDGTPSDAVLFAFDFLERKPDLVVSGLNWGENLTNQAIRSGTLCAALTGAIDRNTPAISCAIEVEKNNWNKEMDGTFDRSLLEYPGKILADIIQLALSGELGRGKIWHINFPKEKARGIKIAKISDDLYYKNSFEVSGNSAKFQANIYSHDHEEKSEYDLLSQGFVVLAPLRINLFDENEYDRLKKN